MFVAVIRSKGGLRDEARHVEIRPGRTCHRSCSRSRRSHLRRRRAASQAPSSTRRGPCCLAPPSLRPTREPGMLQTDVASGAGAFLVPEPARRQLQGHRRVGGVQDGHVPQVAVNVGQEYSLTARLEVGELAETVEVTASSPLIQTTTPEVNRDRDADRRCLQLPIINRDMTNLIRMMPGVPGTVDPHEHGDQRRPRDLDAGDAGRHQHPGQLHPHQRAGLPAEPAFVGQRRRVHHHHVAAGRGVGGRRDVGADGDAVGDQHVPRQRLLAEPRQLARGELVVQQPVQDARSPT